MGNNMNNPKDSQAVAPSNNYLSILQNQEELFLNQLAKVDLPSKNIFNEIKERAAIFKNIESVLEELPLEKRQNSIYLSKFLAAAMSGLFDAALNYLWNETIRDRISRDSAFHQKIKSAHDLLKI